MGWPVGVHCGRPGLISRQVLSGRPLQEIGHDPGDVCLGRPGSGPLSGDAAGMLPQSKAERLSGQGPVHPRHRDPLGSPMVAQPDHGDVVRVVVNLPLLVPAAQS
jgi:hypothetical protein